MMMTLFNTMRHEGDPKVLETGRSSMLTSDRIARGLGWFSLGLGVVQLIAPRRVTSALGLRGSEGLVRAYGAREIAAGLLTLSVEKQAGLLSRVAGDALDIATLVMARGRGSARQRDNLQLALWAVVGITILDVAAAKASMAQHARSEKRPQDFGDRSGFPKGLASARQLGRALHDGAHAAA